MHRTHENRSDENPQHGRKARKNRNSEEKKSRKYGPVKIYIEEELDTPYPEGEE